MKNAADGTATTIEITVPVDIQRFAQNRHHRDWRVRASSDKTAKRAGRAAWIAAGQPRADRHCVVHIVVRRAKHLDYFNIHGACKGIIDGVFKDGVTPDDKPEWVSAGRIVQEISREHRGRESVTFIIEPKGQLLW